MKKKRSQFTRYKSFFGGRNGKKSPHYDEILSEIIIFRPHRSQKKKKSRGEGGVVFNHIAKILKKTIPKLFYFTLWPVAKFGQVHNYCHKIPALCFIVVVMEISFLWRSEKQAAWLLGSLDFLQLQLAGGGREERGRGRQEDSGWWGIILGTCLKKRSWSWRELDLKKIT